MAINPNNSLDNRHVSYCGTSGAGKTVAVKLAGLVGKCAAIFDPYGDYRPTRIKKLSGIGGRKVYHYETRRGFLAAFIAAWQSNKPFLVAYQPKTANQQELRIESIWFASVVWSAADGNRELHAVFEEIGKYTESAGAERSKIGECVTGGRKFGLVCHFVFQRPSEVPKTLITQCAQYIVGAQQSMVDVRYWVNVLDCSENEVTRLGQANQPRKKYYIHKTDGIGNHKEISLSF